MRYIYIYVKMLNVLKINFTTAIYNGKVSFTSLPNLNSITEIVASYLGYLSV